MKYPLADSKLWKELEHRCSSTDLSKPEGIRAGGYLKKLDDLEGVCEEVLALVKAFYPHYLTHGVQHSRAIILRLGQIVPQETLERLSSAELFVLMAAAFCHDIGMVLTQQDIESAETDPSFTDFQRKNSDTLEQIERLRSEGEHFAADLVYRYLLAEYFRHRHAKRSGQLVLANAPDLANLHQGDNRLLKAIMQVCSGHWLSDPRDLEDETRFPTDLQTQDGEDVNVRFCALCLRLADLLDMDSPRACPLVRRLVEDLPEGSEAHWDRHSNLDLRIRSNRISITKTCQSQEEHRLLYEWCDWLRSEVERAAALLATDERCKLKIAPDKLKVDIKSDGSYLFRQYKFGLDEEQVFEKLLGENLYGAKSPFIRELLQNALDATRCRVSEDLRAAGKPWDESKPTWQLPKSVREKYPITFRLELLPRQGEDWLVISCHDCGTGMSRQVIENHFLKVGRSYYDSHEFKSRYSFHPISQFGIGFMSCFMAADYVEVETCCDPCIDDDNAAEEEPMRLHIPGWRNYFTTRPAADRLTKSKRPPNFKPKSYKGHGTSVYCFLKPDVFIDLQKYLENVATYAEFPVRIQYRAVASRLMRTRVPAEDQLFLPKPKRSKVVSDQWPPSRHGVDLTPHLGRASRLHVRFSPPFSPLPHLFQNGVRVFVTPTDPLRGWYFAGDWNRWEQWLALLPIWALRMPCETVIDLWAEDHLNLTTARDGVRTDERAAAFRRWIGPALKDALLAITTEVANHLIQFETRQLYQLSEYLWPRFEPWERPMDRPAFLDALVEITCAEVFEQPVPRTVRLADLSYRKYLVFNEVNEDQAIGLGELPAEEAIILSEGKFLPVWAFHKSFSIRSIGMTWEGVMVELGAPDAQDTLEFCDKLVDKALFDNLGGWWVLNPVHTLAQEVVEAIDKMDVTWVQHPWASTLRRCDEIGIERLDHNGAVLLRSTDHKDWVQLIAYLAETGFLDHQVADAFAEEDELVADPDMTLYL